MEYFQVRYDSRVVIYERKMFIRLATGHTGPHEYQKANFQAFFSQEDGLRQTWKDCLDFLGDPVIKIFAKKSFPNVSNVLFYPSQKQWLPSSNAQLYTIDQNFSFNNLFFYFLLPCSVAPLLCLIVCNKKLDWSILAAANRFSLLSPSLYLHLSLSCQK